MIRACWFCGCHTEQLKIRGLWQCRRCRVMDRDRTEHFCSGCNATSHFVYYEQDEIPGKPGGYHCNGNERQKRNGCGKILPLRVIIESKDVGGSCNAN